MTRSKTTLILTVISMLFVTIPAAAAQTDDGSAPNCDGDVEVQTNPLHNRYSCESCQGSIVVQVGTHNDLHCAGDCHGNIFVQVGTTDWLECAGSLFGQSAASSAAEGFCPKPLPDENFYCHVLARVLPPEFCLSLDFCVW